MDHWGIVTLDFDVFLCLIRLSSIRLNVLIQHSKQMTMCGKLVKLLTSKDKTTTVALNHVNVMTPKVFEIQNATLF